MQVYLGQRHALRLLGILETDVVEIDRAVLYLGESILRAGQIAFFLQNLHDTLSRFHRHGDHHEHHRQHHQAHKNLKAVCKDGGHLPHGNFSAPAGDYGIRTERQHKHHARIHTKLHHGVVKRHDPLGTGKVFANILGRGGEFLFLVVLTHIAFYHAHGLHVFLHRVVERVIFAEYPPENRRGRTDDQDQSDAQQRNGNQENHGQAPAHGKSHNE